LGRPRVRAWVVDRADWSVGGHPWADSLRSLEFGSRGLRFGGDCEFTIGELRRVNRK